MANINTNKKSDHKEKFEIPQDVKDLIVDIKKQLDIKEIENTDGTHSYKTNWEISDIIDENGRQYVDLVQKGGGVWGIALIGFTYVLEEVGIRFLRLAGTSAGAINTILLAAIGNKEDKKSERIVKLLAEKDIFEFVDGHWSIRYILKYLFTKRGMFIVKKVIPLVILLTLVLGMLLLFSPLNENKYLEFTGFSLISAVIVTLLVFLYLLLMLYKRLGQAGFGINPGENFLIWLRGVLSEAKSNSTQDSISNEPVKDKNTLFTIDDLITKVQQKPELKLRRTRKEEISDISDLVGDITIITTDLVTENKIELPRMRELFKTNNSESYQPFNDAAELVRASMAIPVFFESFYVRNIEASITEPFWKKEFKISPPPTCRLVDGGVLSNFPINIYLDPHNGNPRLPTIGINLLDEKDKKDNDPNKSNEENDPHKWLFTNFVGKIFNAARNYYDKDFILKSDAAQKSIANLNIEGIHWLHFGMGKVEKEKLFLMGAKSAYDFLTKKESREDKSYIDSVGPSKQIGFNWDAYKKSRKELAKQLNKNHNVKI